MVKWGFGRRSTTRTQGASDPRPATDAPTGEDRAEGGPDSTWWLGQAEPTRVINRRWRSPRPGDLHPRRRATDAPPPREAVVDDPAAAFDPDALLREQARNLTDDATDATDADADAAPAPWSILDLESEATWDEVVARHRELAKQHHPDRYGDDTDAASEAAGRMAEINAAFAELGRIYRITGDR